LNRSLLLRSTLGLAAAATLASGSSVVLAAGGSGGGGSKVVPTPTTCVAKITSATHTAGYGPYGPNVADIKTKFTVANCTAAAVNWTARVTYSGELWGGTQFALPLTCALPIATRSSKTCTTTERYVLIQHTYGVTIDILNAAGTVLATSSANVATPTVPNPAAT
jgi:hypothetical protein